MKFSKLYEEFEQSIKDDIKKAHKLYEDGILDIEKYNKDVLKQQTVASVELSDIETAEKALNELRNFFGSMEVREAQRGIGFFTDNYTDIDNFDGGSLASFEYNAHCYHIVKFEDMKEYDLIGKFKKYIKQKIKPDHIKLDSYSYRSRDIDCKVLSLYKDGIITLEQLGEATFKDCDI